MGYAGVKTKDVEIDRGLNFYSLFEPLVTWNGNSFAPKSQQKKSARPFCRQVMFSDRLMVFGP